MRGDAQADLRPGTCACGGACHRRAHRGLRSELLELDAGEAIYLLSAHELGALPEDVAVALADLRPAVS